MPRLEDKTQLRKELESMRYINRNFLTGKQGGGKKKNRICKNCWKITKGLKHRSRKLKHQVIYLQKKHIPKHVIFKL